MGKYAKLPARLQAYNVCDKATRRFLGLTLDGDPPRTIMMRICCKPPYLLSPLAKRLLKESTREKYLEWSRDAFRNFLKNELDEEIERYKALPLLPTTPDGKIAAPAEVPRVIWTLWWQANETLSNLPRVAKLCLKTMQGQKGFDTVVITQHNVASYIDISDVLPLYNEGRIPVQFLSDIIRARLLSRHGGVWCDMGILFLDPAYLSELAEGYPFFSNKKRETLEHVSHNLWSTFFWVTYPDNPVMSFLDEAMTKFCLKYGTNFRYVLQDYCLMLEYREVPVARQILGSVPFNNPDIWWLGEHWQESASEWLASSGNGGHDILARNRLFKLSSKTSIDSAPAGSVWKEIEKRVERVFGSEG